MTQEGVLAGIPSFFICKLSDKCHFVQFPPLFCTKLPWLIGFVQFWVVFCTNIGRW